MAQKTPVNKKKLFTSKTLVDDGNGDFQLPSINLYFDPAGSTLTSENTQDAINELDVKIENINLTSNIELTVGSSGDFASIDEALHKAARYKPVHSTGGIPDDITSGYRVDIRLLSGFEIKEQIFIDNIDLSHVRIFSDDETVTIKRDSLTKSFNNPYYWIRRDYPDRVIHPCFMIQNSAISPIFDLWTDMDESGTVKTCGTYVVANNATMLATHLRVGGTTGHNIHITSGHLYCYTNLDCRNSISPGQHTDNNTGDSYDINSNGIKVESGSVKVEGFMDTSGNDHNGFKINSSATVNVKGYVNSNNNGGNGGSNSGLLNIGGGARNDIPGAGSGSGFTVNDNGVDGFDSHGGYTTVSSGEVTASNNGTRGLELEQGAIFRTDNKNITANKNVHGGVLIKNTASLYIVFNGDLICSNNSSSGIIIRGGTLVVDSNITTEDNNGKGLNIDKCSSVLCGYIVSKNNDNDGISCFDASNISVNKNVTASNNTNRGITLWTASSILIHDTATIDNNGNTSGDYGLQVTYNASFYSHKLYVSNSTDDGINLRRRGDVTVQQEIDCTGHSEWGIAVYEYSFVVAPSISANTNVNLNNISINGGILQS